jgi:diadenylate cyclase
MIRKMANIINTYIIELGREGVIVRMRMREVTKGIDKTRELIIGDYLQRPARVKQFFDNLSFDGLLDAENIAHLLFGDSSETRIIPKGGRILSKTNLSENEIKSLINNFKNLEGILGAEELDLQRVLKSRTESFKEELSRIREQIMIGKKI